MAALFQSILWVLLALMGGVIAIIWLYIVARVVTRAVLRTLKEMKKDE